MERRLRFLTWLVVGVVVLSLTVVGIVYALETTIDGFDDEQFLTANPGPSCESVNDTSVFGSYRDVEVNRTSGSGTVFFETAGGFGTYNNPTGGYGTTLIQWDGDDDSTTTCPLPDPSTSIVDIDLTAGGADRFVIGKGVQDNDGGSIRIRVYENGGGSNDYAEYTWSNLTESVTLLSADFSSFSENGNWSNATDWSSVGAVTMLINADINALDLPFDFVGTNQPTAVSLAAFSAEMQEDAVLVSWKTATEIDNVGFNLYRSPTSDGEYVKLNGTVIASQNPGVNVGTAYTWTDSDVTPGSNYFYKLEDIDADGTRSFHGPVEVLSEETSP